MIVKRGESEGAALQPQGMKGVSAAGGQADVSDPALIVVAVCSSRAVGRLRV